MLHRHASKRDLRASAQALHATTALPTPKAISPASEISQTRTRRTWDLFKNAVFITSAPQRTVSRKPLCNIANPRHNLGDPVYDSPVHYITPARGSGSRPSRPPRPPTTQRPTDPTRPDSARLNRRGRRRRCHCPRGPPPPASCSPASRRRRRQRHGTPSSGVSTFTTRT